MEDNQAYGFKMTLLQNSERQNVDGREGQPTIVTLSLCKSVTSGGGLQRTKRHQQEYECHDGDEDASGDPRKFKGGSSS